MDAADSGGSVPPGPFGRAFVALAAAAFFDAADVVDVGEAHGFQLPGRFGTGLAAVGVDVEGEVAVREPVLGLVQVCQGEVLAVGDALEVVLPGGADVQQNRARGGLELPDTTVDVGAEQTGEDTHTKLLSQRVVSFVVDIIP